MRQFKLLRKALFALSLSLFALLSVIVMASQIDQHIFRRRAERLLAESQTLELRKTPWPEALHQFQHWGGAMKFSDICNEHECSLEIHLSEPVYGFVSRSYFFVRLDDYLRWRLNLSYQMGPFAQAEYALLRGYLLLGGRPAVVGASLGMRDGIVWSKEFTGYLETFAHGVPNVWDGEYSLIADIRSIPKFDRYEARNPQLMLHSNYVIGRPGGCEICISGWVHFTPYADPDDVHRLMAVNLSCLIRLHPCQTQQDIMPNAWAQYLAEAPRVDQMWSQPVCSDSTIEMLGRDGANVIIGEIATYSEKLSDNQWQGRASVKLLETIKGGGNWKIGDTHEMGIFRRPDRAIRIGSRFILTFDDPTQFDTIPYEAITGCSPLPANETNLKDVLRGVDQDYSAGETTSEPRWHW
jgi:hypothetical protein